MSWPTVALGDAVSFKGGGTPSRNNDKYWKGEIPWATVKDLNFGHSLAATQESITKDGLMGSASNLIPSGTVIIPTRMALGKAVVSEIDVAINQDLKAVFPTKALNPRFLLWYFIANSSRIEAMGKGATVKGVTLDQLRALQIPLPPLAEQGRIAAILDKADALRAKRRAAIAKLDQLLQSVFLDMFGDPVTNPHQFPIRRLPDFYISSEEGTRCGPFGSALKRSDVVAEGIPLWNMDNISELGRMVLPFRAWVTSEKAQQLSSYLVRDGDILISRAGTVGKMCVVRVEEDRSLITTNLIRLRLGDGLLPEFFVALMTYFKGRMGRLKSGSDGTFTHMSTSVLDGLSFPYPPVDRQTRFSEIAEKVESLKREMQTSATKLDTLLDSLQQRAFAGGLQRVAS